MKHHGAVIVYDGECPFCSRYVHLIRLKKVVGTVRLVDARTGGPEAAALWRGGYDLNEGMALIYGGQVFYGADCINKLALMTTRSDLFNKAAASLFSSPAAASVLYPALKLGRRITLRILGRSRLNRPSKD